MECKKPTVMLKKTGNRRKDKSKKRQATEREETEVENEKRGGKRTREEITRGSSLLHTAVRGQKLQRILGMWLASETLTIKRREKEKERCT